ncbi:MAG: ribonuclease PH [Candidatus Hydromicrobium sp.]|nr:ribonuclease PH [Chloroflexota bacterium]MBE3114699.1 ribonuclease PH [Actinomycetota bacterium]
MVKRIDNRKNDRLREIKVTRNYISHADGSVFIEMGKTRIVCTATVEDKVPRFLAGKGSGWITAEYDMIPGAAPQRIVRAQTTGRINGRTHEIQRLIGRSLRAVVDLNKIGERTVWIDCDVIEADGGTRTASITGSFIALFDCMHSLIEKKIIDTMPIENFLAAVSVGIVDGEILVDLCFEEDSRAQVDMNVVMDSKGELIEVQSTAELSPFSREDFDKMLEKATSAIKEIIEIQKKILSQDL